MQRCFCMRFTSGTIIATTFTVPHLLLLMQLLGWDKFGRVPFELPRLYYPNMRHRLHRLQSKANSLLFARVFKYQKGSYS
jgi:hypothetical protein